MPVKVLCSFIGNTKKSALRFLLWNITLTTFTRLWSYQWVQVQYLDTPLTFCEWKNSKCKTIQIQKFLYLQ